VPKGFLSLVNLLGRRSSSSSLLPAFLSPFLFISLRARPVAGNRRALPGNENPSELALRPDKRIREIVTVLTDDIDRGAPRSTKISARRSFTWRDRAIHSRGYNPLPPFAGPAERAVTRAIVKSFSLQHFQPRETRGSSASPRRDSPHDVCFRRFARSAGPP